MAVFTHILCIRLERPLVVTEGEEFAFTYTITNMGELDFPGGHVTVELKWPLIEERVFQPLIIDEPLPPRSELTFSRKQAPLTAGYTVFYIHVAVANDQNPVQVVNDTGGQLWPPQNELRLLFDAVRARTHEEITSTDIRTTLGQNVNEMKLLNRYSKRLDWLTILLLLTTSWLFFIAVGDFINSSIVILSLDSIILYVVLIISLSTIALIIVLYIAERKRK